MADASAKLRAQRDALNATFMRDWGSSLGSGGLSAGTSPRVAGQQHTSLLATPASRSQGGRITQPPSRNTLSMYERGLEAAAGYSRSPAQRAGAAAAAAAAISSAALPPSRFAQPDPSPLRQQQRQQHPALQRAATAAPDLARVLGGAGAGASPAQALPSSKPSLLAQHVASTGAGASSLAATKASGAALLASLGQGRPSPRPAATSDSLQEAMQQMQLSLSRTAAANSAVAAASSAGVTASPLRPASGLRPSQQAQHADFRIPAAFASSRLGAASTAPCAGSAARPPAPAAAPASQDSDGGAVAISMRLTPMFDAVSPSSSGSQTGQPASADWGSPRHQAAPAVPQLNVRTQQAAQPAAWQEHSAASSPSTAVLASRVNELEAQVGSCLLVPWLGCGQNVALQGVAAAVCPSLSLHFEL